MQINLELRMQRIDQFLIIVVQREVNWRWLFTIITLIILVAILLLQI